MESLEQYIPQLMITAGIIILAIEVAVLGFATFILFFLGLSLVITGAACWLGIMPATWPVILLSNAILSTVLAAVLWRPLLRMQSKTDDKRVKSDFDGHRFVISDAVDKSGSVRYSFSGIQWKLKSEAEIAAGSEVEVVKAEVGVLWVKLVS
jgi:membrane protein implicated in regulation of membrane protease activity